MPRKPDGQKQRKENENELNHRRLASVSINRDCSDCLAFSKGVTMNTFQIFGTSLLGLLPAIIAWVRGHPKRWWILLLALSSGLLGPIICLIGFLIIDLLTAGWLQRQPVPDGAVEWTIVALGALIGLSLWFGRFGQCKSLLVCSQ